MIPLHLLKTSIRCTFSLNSKLRIQIPKIMPCLFLDVVQFNIMYVNFLLGELIIIIKAVIR